ncbi:saccharopine dehydrogenase C-terminal domain-containing protein [Streptomyces sp. NPDC091267]|uniref:saccharopine dehydrogenase C-terminal domain-containing protein n=1 Tax=Streptomyces sp. NPDC091267 TaxID=3155195 RepID=UPI003438558F
MSQPMQTPRAQPGGAAAAVAVVGCGSMGQALAAVAAAELGPARLHLVDVDAERTGAAAAALPAGTEVVRHVGWGSALDGVGTALLALPWDQTERFLAETRDLPLAAVSITRPPVRPAPYLPERLRERKGPALLPVGLEPGLTEILIARALRYPHRTDDIEVLCGGVTAERPGGFPYRMLFGGTTLPFARRPAFRIEDGSLVTGERFSGVCPAALPGLPELESYHDGMVPWLQESLGTAGVRIEQRTVRWPGFAAAVSVLHDSGLLAAEPVDVDGTAVVPRRLTETQLAGRLRRAPAEREVTHVQVTAAGPAPGGGRRVRRTGVWCRDDHTALESGMAVLTAVPAVHAARLATALPPGWHRPEAVFDDASTDRLLAALRAFGAHVHDSAHDNGRTSL